MPTDHTDSQRERLGEIEDEVRERVLPDRSTEKSKKPALGQRGDERLGVGVRADVRAEW
jgi:hypothetical protein